VNNPRKIYGADRLEDTCPLRPGSRLRLRVRWPGPALCDWSDLDVRAHDEGAVAGEAEVVGGVGRDAGGGDGEPLLPRPHRGRRPPPQFDLGQEVGRLVELQMPLVRAGSGRMRRGASGSTRTGQVAGSVEAVVPFRYGGRAQHQGGQRNAIIGGMADVATVASDR
jgi:hypothetical protein